MSGTFLRQGLKKLERPKSPLGFFLSVYWWRIKLKIHNVQKTKANGALTRENQIANNKSVEKA